MFLFLSHRLGGLDSLLASGAITVVLLLILNVT